MIYLDYTWDLTPNAIILDSELNTDNLGWKHGDYFKFVNINGRPMLQKVDPLVKFIKDGEQN